jgi:hypothetical protein
MGDACGCQAEAAQRALIAQVRAGLVLLAPQDITPMGVRVLEGILSAAEESLPPAQ